MLISAIILAENVDTASHTKFTEEFIRKMEEWEQKKFGQCSVFASSKKLILFYFSELIVALNAIIIVSGSKSQLSESRLFLEPAIQV